MIKAFQNGYTLVELLVVITIIALLTTIGASVYSTSQRNARDAARRASIKQMQSAMEQYYSTNDSSYTDGCTELDTLIQTGTPTDPQTKEPFDCVVSGGGADYCVYAVLENENGNCEVSGGSCSYVTDASGTHFCSTALQ
ncbi:MAG: type II secretion system protein, partial [Candidatus Doudnabacteria bacterium]|nr:type II secretion system protein [Candidatus Doudnabacteria bacterium]